MCKWALFFLLLLFLIFICFIDFHYLIFINIHVVNHHQLLWAYKNNSYDLIIHNTMFSFVFNLFSKNCAVSAGTSKKDAEKVEQIIKAIPSIQYICLDVANGYSEAFVQCVKEFRQKFPEQTIMVGVEIHVYTLFVECLFPNLSIILHWASKETYYFFRATLTKIYAIKINNIWTQISFNTS